MEKRLEENEETSANPGPTDLQWRAQNLTLQPVVT